MDLFKQSILFTTLPDFLMLGAQYSGSGKLKSLFEKLNVYGVQFIPVEIESNKGEIINGHYIIHIWNRLPAIDKNNYIGEQPNEFGNILSLKRFSLDAKILDAVSPEKRLAFSLEEKGSMVIIHQSIYETIQKENLTGVRFFRVDEWDSDAMFK